MPPDRLKVPSCVVHKGALMASIYEQSGLPEETSDRDTGFTLDLRLIGESWRRSRSHIRRRASKDSCFLAKTRESCSLLHG